MGPLIVCREYLKEASRCTIQEAVYVGLYEDVDMLLLEGASQCVKALVGTTLRAVAVATLLEQRLEEWFEHSLGSEFHDLVLEAADPQWAPRLAARLRNVYPALGLGTVAHPFEAGGEILEGCLQVLPVLFLGDPIHSHRRIGTLTARGALEGWPIHQMRQCVASSFGVALRSFHSLHKSW